MRNVSFLSSAALAALFVGAFAVPVSAAGDPTGIWLDDAGRGAVEIKSCGGALCGKVVWVKSAKDRHGCGKQILGGVKSSGGNWDGGWIYSPEHGRKFDVELTPVGSSRLKVFGYAGVRLFGQTRTWTRAPADLERCDGGDGEIAKAAPAAADKPVKTAKVEAPVAPAAPARTSDAPRVEDRVVANEAVPAPVPAKREIVPPTPTPSPARQAQPEAEAPAVVAAAEPPREEIEDVEEAPKQRTSGLGSLSFDKVLKKTGDGRCKLDLPWVKLNFTCRDR